MTITNKIGIFLRNKFPKIYLYITENFINKHQAENVSTIGSFKEYLAKYAMEAKLESLTSGMDDYSVKTLNVVFLRLLNLPEGQFNILIDPHKNSPIGGYLDEEKEYYDIKAIKKDLKIKLPSTVLESSVFKYHHGLTFLSKDVLEYIKDGDFIDGGAFIGDSALSFRKYAPKKVYSIEMSHFSIKRYKDIMLQHGVNENQYKIINCGIGKEKGSISIPDTGRLGMSISGKGKEIEKFQNIDVDILSLDEIIQHNGIEPKFIKLDIEGAGMDAIQGGINSIKKYRPILSIGIYHNPIEFFEIKPFLEKNLEDYTYMVRKLETSWKRGNTDVTLLAFPQQL